MKTRFRLCLWPIAVCLCSTSSFAAQADPVETLAKLSLDWAKTRSEAVRAEGDWASQRELLESTVTALEERARELESKRDLLKAKTAKDRGDLENLEIENQRLAEQFKILEIRLKAIGEHHCLMKVFSLASFRPVT